jgi:hypothetical protein
MGKYLSGADTASGTIMSRGCGGLSGYGGLPGYVNDTIGLGCWAVHGAPIIIGGSYMSVQAGFECCNFNFRVEGTQSPVPSKLYLRGVV